MWSTLGRSVGDAATGGYRRFAWTAADRELREWFAGRGARAAAWTWSSDRNGNQWAWWGDPDAGPGVVTGSHLDSVPDGGAFDGPLGVVVGVRRRSTRCAPRGSGPPGRSRVVELRRRGGRPVRRGLRRLPADHRRADRRPGARRCATRDGITLAEAMDARRARPRPSAATTRRCGRIGAFVELHVEQGRALSTSAGRSASASAIWPHGRWRFDFAGRGQPRRHHPAGGPPRPDARPTPPPSSPPAAAAAAHGCVATFGKVRVEPNGVNAIPSLVTAGSTPAAADEAALRRGRRATSPRPRRAPAPVEESLDRESSTAGSTPTLARTRSPALLDERAACCRPAPATTPGSSPRPGCRPRCCSSATPPASRTRRRVRRARPTAWPGSTRWPTVLERAGRAVTAVVLAARVRAGCRRRRRAASVRFDGRRDGRIAAGRRAGVADPPAGRRAPARADAAGPGQRPQPRVPPRAARPHAGGGGTFWTWREQMYAVAARSTRTRYLALARAVYAEMALAGITCVGEFHYLHHEPGGTPYDDPNAMGQALIEAAADAGHPDHPARHLLPRRRLRPARRSRAAAAAVRRRRRRRAGPTRVAALEPTGGHARIGAAIHSVRAVPARPAGDRARRRRGAAPLHVHLSEQPAENDACLAALRPDPDRSCSPSTALLGAATTAVHATHLTDDDIAAARRRRDQRLLLPHHRARPRRRHRPGRAPARRRAPAHAGQRQPRRDRPVRGDARRRARRAAAHPQRGHWTAAELLARRHRDGHAASAGPTPAARGRARAPTWSTVALDSVRTAGAGPTGARPPSSRPPPPTSPTSSSTAGTSCATARTARRRRPRSSPSRSPRS